MLFILSWRNVWRNKVRSTIMIIAIALGIAAGIFSTAFYKGMARQRIEKVILTEIGHIQLHHPEFRKANDLSYYVQNADKIAETILHMDGVAGVSDRIVVNSMIASAESGAGVKIMGIDPKDEKLATNVHTKLKEGNYFEEGRRNPILIGQKLAEKLNVRLGSKVVITLQDMGNNITSGAFRIVGIFNTVNSMFDEANVFVLKSDLMRLTNLPEGAGHEITILANDINRLDALKAAIASEYPSLEILKWNEISPEMSYLTEAMDVFMYAFIVIILLALLFGIINTMLMAVLDRTKELGMLMAVGMDRLRIFLMIMIETVMLSITGGLVGVVLGAFLSKYFETHKIDLSIWGDVYINMGYDPYVYTSLDWNLLANITILVFFTGIIASIYPALKALNNDPASALRIE